jgi:hypothetical protein
MNAHSFAAIGITAHGNPHIVAGQAPPSASRSRHLSAAIKSHISATRVRALSNEEALQIGVEIQRRQRIFGRSGRI